MMPVCDSSNEMLFMKINYLASLILVPKWYPWKLAAFITWYMYHNVLKFHEEKLHYIYWLYDIATLWYLYRTLNRCKITYFHGKYYDTYIIHWTEARKLVFMENIKIPYTLNWCKGAYFQGKHHYTYIIQWTGAR